MKHLRHIISGALITLSLFFGGMGFAQSSGKPIAAVLGIDAKGVVHDGAALAYMVRLEVEKTGVYATMDKYDMNDILTKSDIDPKTCMGKTCLVNAGRALKANKMITGAVERFGEKIVITLRVIDVATEGVEKTNATEYLNLQPEIQKMIEISVKRLLGLTPDQNLVNLLIDYEQPITSPKTSLRLNGPRMGASYTFGENGSRMTESITTGGFDMFPITSQFGWQQEFQYMSAGNFQGLIETVWMIGGLENGKMIPSLTLLNGFRDAKSGWEFAIGPSFRVVQKAKGFYDDNGYFGNEGIWYLEKDYSNMAANDSTGIIAPSQNPYTIINRLDSRGDYQLSTGLIIAVGKTIRSGYLNIPLNAYVSPRKEGTIVGFSFGFNIAKKQKIQY